MKMAKYATDNWIHTTFVRHEKLILKLEKEMPNGDLNCIYRDLLDLQLCILDFKIIPMTLTTKSQRQQARRNDRKKRSRKNEQQNRIKNRKNTRHYSYRVIIGVRDLPHARYEIY